jgi:hypothetical protein
MVELGCGAGSILGKPVGRSGCRSRSFVVFGER